MMRSLTCCACFGLVSAAVLGGCSSPELAGTNFACSTSSDCLSGEVCAEMNGNLACMASAAVPELHIGMIGPMQGPSEDLGREMSRGIEAMLRNYNDAGGAFGRRVVLDKRNDNYDPAVTLQMMHELLDVTEPSATPDQPDVRGNDSVFALVGNVGTPTMLATAPVATKNKVVYFAPFTGAQEYLRDSTKSPYVYNYRAGYFDETAAMVEYIFRGRIPAVITNPQADYQRILVFAQEDSFGNAGYNGVISAYNQNVAQLPAPDAIERIGYIRENLDTVPPAVVEAGAFLEGVLARAPAGGTSKEPVAIIMIDTYAPGDRFIRGVKDWINADAARAARLDVVFMNVSFVGSDSLAEALTASPREYLDVVTSQPRPYAENVIVTQVVPDYDSEAPGVVQYREDIRQLDSGDFSFISLEGYIVTRLFTQALTLNGPRLTSDEFVRTLDTKISNIDVGIGTLLNFSATDHQASDTVWGTQIGADGSFDMRFVWQRGTDIQIEE
jgi:ABC-type branched-subunit amino acid transport system substrate-binding protein